jgi:uncharacterized protein
MKKVLLMLVTVFTITAQAQEFKQIPLVNVSGEGKIKVAPDQASISVSVETKGSKAVDVKKENDTKIDAVIKYIKKMNIAATDFQTQRVYLNDQYDYEKKKHNYVATQTITILLKDLSKYDIMMEGLVETGINTISGVEFKTSKLEQLKSEARKLAMADAKLKANDYASALGQKVGAAFSVTDNTAVDYPRPRYEMMAMKMADSAFSGNETLAVGEIEITANASVSFNLL